MMKSLKAVLILLALLPATPRFISSAQEIEPLAITHAVIIDGHGKLPFEDGTLLIRAGKIDAVGPFAAINVPANARVIDAKGKAVMPGLADMHVHLTGGWDGDTVDMLGFQRYLNALLYAGVTTVLDTGNVQPYILQLRQEVAAGRLAGPRIYFAGALIDGADPIWPPLSFGVASVEVVPKIVQHQKRGGVDVIKAYAGLSDQLIAALVREGKKNNLRVFVDQGSRNGSIDLMLAGIAAFAHLPTRKMSDEAVSLMKERSVHAITTLTIYEFRSRLRLADLGFLASPLIKDTTPPWFLEELSAFAKKPLTTDESTRATAGVARLREAQRNARKLVDAGILLAAGTDAPYPGVFQGEGIHRELELLVEAGLSPLEAITIATKNAALLMNAGDEWGTLAPGRVANLILINGRPDKNISETHRIEMVIQAGKIVEREKLKFDLRRDGGFRASAPVSANQ